MGARGLRPAVRGRASGAGNPTLPTFEIPALLGEQCGFFPGLELLSFAQATPLCKNRGGGLSHVTKRAKKGIREVAGWGMVDSSERA